MLQVDLRVDAHAAAHGQVVFADQRALAVHTTLRTQAHVVASAAMVGVAGGVDAGACAVGGSAHTGQRTAPGLADLTSRAGVAAGATVARINLKISAAVTA